MNKKTKGLLILLIIYVLAYIVGLLSFIILENYTNINEILNLFIADAIATTFVFLIGIILKTASVYDPYWSVQTIMIYISLMIKHSTYNIGSFIYLGCILFYTIRLTGNFIKGFNDISYIDWRYSLIKEKTGKFYQLVSFIGINMVPTIVVFTASIPTFLYIINGCNFELLNIIGLLIMILAIICELVSDNDMRRFKKIRTSNKEIINIGLWKYSRHPNYFGEISFWYGVAFVFIFSNINMWYVILGAILNTLLFIFISVPLAEGHLKTYKDGFDEYKKKTNMFLPLKIFKK